MGSVVVETTVAVGVGGLMAVAAAEAVVVRSHPTALVAAAEVA